MEEQPADTFEAATAVGLEVAAAADLVLGGSIEAASIVHSTAEQEVEVEEEQSDMPSSGCLVPTQQLAVMAAVYQHPEAAWYISSTRQARVFNRCCESGLMITALLRGEAAAHAAPSSTQHPLPATSSFLCSFPVDQLYTLVGTRKLMSWYADQWLLQQTRVQVCPLQRPAVEACATQVQREMEAAQDLDCWLQLAVHHGMADLLLGQPVQACQTWLKVLGLMDISGSSSQAALGPQVLELLLLTLTQLGAQDEAEALLSAHPAAGLPAAALLGLHCHIRNICDTGIPCQPDALSCLGWSTLMSAADLRCSLRMMLADIIERGTTTAVEGRCSQLPCGKAAYKVLVKECQHLAARAQGSITGKSLMQLKALGVQLPSEQQLLSTLIRAEGKALVRACHTDKLLAGEGLLPPAAVTAQLPKTYLQQLQPKLEVMSRVALAAMAPHSDVRDLTAVQLAVRVQEQLLLTALEPLEQLSAIVADYAQVTAEQSSCAFLDSWSLGTAQPAAQRHQHTAAIADMTRHAADMAQLAATTQGLMQQLNSRLATPPTQTDDATDAALYQSVLAATTAVPCAAADTQGAVLNMYVLTSQLCVAVVDSVRFEWFQAAGLNAAYSSHQQWQSQQHQAVQQAVQHVEQQLTAWKTAGVCADYTVVLAAMGPVRQLVVEQQAYIGSSNLPGISGLLPESLVLVLNECLKKFKCACITTAMEGTTKQYISQHDGHALLSTLTPIAADVNQQVDLVTVDQRLLGVYSVSSQDVLCCTAINNGRVLLSAFSKTYDTWCQLQTLYKAGEARAAERAAQAAAKAAQAAEAAARAAGASRAAASAPLAAPASNSASNKWAVQGGWQASYSLSFSSSVNAAAPPGLSSSFSISSDVWNGTNDDVAGGGGSNKWAVNAPVRNVVSDDGN
eukprot:jgi/Chrzof1/3881/Cz13g11350.t1